jgi:hypothetical protein
MRARWMHAVAEMQAPLSACAAASYAVNACAASPSTDFSVCTPVMS